MIMSTRNSKINNKNILVVVFSLLFAIISGVISQDWLVGSAILFCGLLSAYFASIGKRSNYLFGLVSYILMGCVAFHNRLFGTGAFYIFVCAPLQIHGFISWSQNLVNTNVKTRKFNFKISLLVITSCIVGSLVVGFLLSLIPSQQLGLLDAASNCVNLCGIILMNLRYMEAWWLWLVNNVLDFSIWAWILFIGKGDGAVMMLITCVMYLVINVYGIYKWIKSSKISLDKSLGL